MHTNILSILLDYKCNFWCDHCSVGSNPRLSVPMSNEVFDAALRAMKDVPTIQVVVFTGGECTLHMSQLIAGITAAKQAGKLTRIVTNGWFAKSDNATQRLLDQLVEAGLDEISTSFDAYHEPFVSVEQICRLLVHAHSRNLRVALGVIEDPQHNWTLPKVRTRVSALCGWPLEDLEQHVSIISDSPTPVGSGDRPEIHEAAISPSAGLGCSDVLKSVSIHPNGFVKACCGHTMFYQKDLHLGHILEEPLPDILNRADRNLVYWYIHTLGPSEILRQLGHSGRFTSICHACNVLLNEHRDEFLGFLRTRSKSQLSQDLVFQGNLKEAARTLVVDEDKLLRRLRNSNRARQSLSAQVTKEVKNS